MAPRDVSGPLVLVASPFLDPACWDPVAQILRDGGHDVAVSPAGVLPVVDDPATVLEALLDGIPGDAVLVLHSNAGLYAADLVTRRRARAVVFVDAGVPVGSGPQPLAPPAFLEALTPLADDAGLLPPWDRWFDPADVAALFPDDDTQVRLTGSLPRVALAYLRSRLDVDPAWTSTPCAYLAFGTTYAEERSRAEASRWPVTTLDGDHLHLLVDPVRVAAEVLRLAQLVTDR